MIFRLLKIAKDEGNAEELKQLVSIIYYINELIESKYVYSKQEYPDKNEYMKLRANILSSLRTYLKEIYKLEPNFKFKEYYDTTKYAYDIKITQKQLGVIKKAVTSLIL